MTKNRSVNGGKGNNMKKIYLACPYSHPDPMVRQQRFDMVCQKAAELMEQGYCVFSPISHSHPISKYTTADANNYSFCLKQDMAWLMVCDEFHILCLPGWEESIGVKIEDLMADLVSNIPVIFHEVDN